MDGLLRGLQQPQIMALFILLVTAFYLVISVRRVYRFSPNIIEKLTKMLVFNLTPTVI